MIRLHTKQVTENRLDIYSVYQNKQHFLGSIIYQNDIGHFRAVKPVVAEVLSYVIKEMNFYSDKKLRTIYKMPKTNG